MTVLTAPGNLEMAEMITPPIAATGYFEKLERDKDQEQG